MLSINFKYLGELPLMWKSGEGSMKILVTPVGIYIGRVIRGIATIKPDKIYLCVQKSPKKEELKLPTSARHVKWMNTTRKHAKKIMKKLDIMYGKDNIKIIEIDIDDYLSIFKDLLQLILSFKPDTEVYIDTTSTTYPFRVATITLSIFLKNVKFIYIPASKPPHPEDYSRQRVTDKGLPPRIIPAPKIDFTELQSGILKDILVKINTKFSGKAPSVTDLLLELGLENDKGNMIKMSKYLKKLESYGCLTTVKEGRMKKIHLTMIGSSISEVLKNV